MSVDLHTDDLSNDLGTVQRDQLIENFKVIELKLNELDGVEDVPETDTGISNEEINKKLSEMSARINRIIQGTDSPSIELVVMQILKNKGVI